jgi:PAS domain S-box-containing protein
MKTFADQAVIAIENVRLFNELQQRNREITENLEYQTAISEILRVIASSPTDIQPVLDAISENALKLCGANFSAVYNYDGKMLDMTSLRNFTPQATEEIRREYPRPLTRDGGYSARSILDKKIIHVVDALNDPDIPEATRPLVASLGFRSGLWVPMLREGNAIGAFCVARPEPGAFDEKKIHLLQTFADQATIAIENVRLFNETQRLLKETEQRAAELAIINSMGDALAGQIELDALIQLVGNKMRETFNAQIVYVALLDRTTNLIHFPYYNENGKPRVDPPMPFGQGLTSKIIQTREPLLINQNVEQRRTELGVVRQGTPAKSYLGVPILVGSEAIGVISVQSTEEENRFDEADLRLLSTIAAGVGIAIERTRLYESTQSQKQYFEGIVFNSPVAIVTVDLNSHIVEWNPAAEKLFGYPKAEALGRDVDELVALSDEIREEAAACSLKAMRGELASYLTRRNRKDGSLVDVQMWAVPVTVNGTRVGAIALYNDISELIRARREAESANQAKSAFLATMSHEIRTPMNAVIGMSNLLLGTNLNDEQREYADVIHNSGDALLTIINDILDFSKIEAGKMELDQQPFDLRECVESALDLVTTRATEKSIDLAYIIDENVPAAIFGDATRLRQVLLNLLSNAVKFTERGEVVLLVTTNDERRTTNESSAFVLRPSSSVLHFSVRDTGIGISPEQTERLFQSFSQADASTSRKYGGTGLGLAISKRLVELMRGTMWVESEGVGKGSTFHFTIQAQAALDFVPQARTFPAGEQPLLRGKRVLIVDDNATNRRILARQLQLWGMVTQDTESAREALAWLARGDSFDVAILDLQMPEMDGVQLATEIRKQPDGTRLPMILFSSLGRREAGADESLFAAYITKPIKLSMLFDALMNVFAHEHAAGKSAPAKSQIDPQMAMRLPLRILLVEDNAVNQKLALRILSQMGYRADVAANGLEALDAIDRQKYDVVLMDVQMPEMDGLEATRQIVARWQRGARPRIVAMTANVTQGDREMCLAAGMDDYIAKPIRVEELIAALTKAGQANG